MICAKCKKEEESNNELLSTIKQTADNIIKIACAEEYYYSDRLRIEKIVEDIYNKGFNDGYRQSIKDDYSI